MITLGLKHGKYIYVKRSDGWYVKIRVLNIRFKKKKEQGDVLNPSRYVITGYKTSKPPHRAIVINEETLPEETRRELHLV